MTDSKLDTLTEEILTYIFSQNYQSGDRLPAERKLAELFSASRNTVREALRILREREVIEIRKGSGCYVKSLPLNNSDSSHGESAEIVANQLEARYMIEPEVAELAMTRISDGDIEKLVNIIVVLSQAIIRRDYSSIIKQDNLFRRVLAQSTGNAVLVMTLRQLEINTHHTWKMLSALPDEALNRVFATYVKTLNAIQAREVAEVKNRVREIILTLCEVFTQYSSLDFSALFNKEKFVKEIF